MLEPPRAPIVECVPNFSEGRDAGKVQAIAAAIASVEHITPLDITFDTDHNRSVITFAGPPDPVAEAAFRAVAKARELIDLTRQSGAHPRIGAADVVPFVPVRGITLEGCARLAISVAERIWRELRIPVYLYEAAARIPERARLENIRRGGFEGLREAAQIDTTRFPDIGGPALHPTAGATVVGARKFLIAFNINLNTPDVSVAKSVAAKVRASSGGLPHVKALGLSLPSRSLAQVSLNLTDFCVTPVGTVFRLVRELAAAQGIEVAECELIGLILRAALEDSEDWLPLVVNFHPGRILENRLGL